MTSLGLAIVLFILIAAYSIIGTVLPQGMGNDFYIEKYNTLGNVISVLQLNKVYSSLVFRAMLLLFIINLTGCTIKIFPSQLRKMKNDYFLKPKNDEENLYKSGVDIKSFEKLLKKKGFKITDTENGYIASKHRIGNVGSTVTHIGIIIIILASFIGNLFSEEGFFNMLPGDVKNFPEYNFALRLDDFQLKFRENGTIEQYYSDFSVLTTDGPERSENVWVNKPLKVKSLNFYQTSYGWASRMDIRDKNNEVIETKVLRNNESYFFKNEHVTVYLYGYYPDFVLTSQGEPVSMTEQEKNPYYAVILYQYNNYIDSYVLEPGQPVKFGEYEITFQDSKLYTGITYRKDFGYLFVLTGSMILLLGLAFSFYLYPKFIFVEHGVIKTSARQNSWGFNYQIKRYLGELIKNEGEKQWT